LTVSFFLFIRQRAKNKFLAQGLALVETLFPVSWECWFHFFFFLDHLNVTVITLLLDCLAVMVNSKE